MWKSVDRMIVAGCLWWVVMLYQPCGFADEVDFAHQIVPLLKTHCAKCHTGTQQEGGLLMNTREELLIGGDSGPAIEIGQHATSELFLRITSTTESYRMPPEGVRLAPAQIDLIAKWIDQEASWEPGFTFAPRLYDPPLRPRRPELPPPVADRQHPLDRILDFDLASRQQIAPAPSPDEVFLRRVSLDLVGLLPTAQQRAEFLADSRPDKRLHLVDRLLNDEIGYADHWLTFWNDLLRNDYTGTGFITGGRTQITTWLYDALLRNKPYDQMARELIAPPNPDSAGFINGIRWRGEVSAGQTVEIQFAQSVGQSFLGINLKCASCHDSFVDRWTLNEAIGLAAIYSERPLELHRCDKPLGQTAEPKWLFPELGQVDAAVPKAQRLEQLAELLTQRENGRFTRTIVNRLWHRLMGRGIVHPTDAMQSEPWNEDLLDYLAVHLADQNYDLKQTLRLIVTSAAYQSQVEAIADSADNAPYVYRGPRAKRLTAEQFMDAVWQLTGTAPEAMDAQVQHIRSKVQTATPAETPAEPPAAIGTRSDSPMVRASLVKSDFLMRSLGRPNRDQIVSVRPTEMTTLEAIDLAIGETLDNYLQRGATRLAAQTWDNPEAFVRWLFQSALTREPSPDELTVLTAELSLPLEPAAIADTMWAVLMLPEFQTNR